MVDTGNKTYTQIYTYNYNLRSPSNPVPVPKNSELSQVIVTSCVIKNFQVVY